MALYKYKAKNEMGKYIVGSCTGNSREEVVALIKQSNCYPVRIKEVKTRKFLTNISLVKKADTKDIAVFSRQFYTMLNAGLPIVKCLDVLKVQTENKKFRKVLEGVYDELQKGNTFANALRSQEAVFPELFINMVEAGEISGNLDAIMNRMALHYEKEDKINNKVKGSMVYPIMLSIVSIGVIVFLLTFVMPTFVNMFITAGVPLPLPTRILLFISDTLVHYWHIYLVIALLICYLTYRGIHSEEGKKMVDKIKLRVPIIRNTIIKILTSRFSRTLATLLSSGIPLIQALESVAKVVGNKVVEEGIEGVIQEVTRGTTLADAVKRIGVFPPMVISMIEVGETSGALDDIMDKTANFYDEESQAALHKMTTLLEPLMIVIMALIIGFIVIAMLLPMFDMLNTLDM